MISRTVTAEADLAAIVARIPPMPEGVRPSREQIAAAVMAIVERFHPARIMLYGSRAYGTPHGESDADLMVVMDTPLPPQQQAERIREAVGTWRPGRLDIKVRTSEQIRIGLAERDFFILDVMVEGITLYGGSKMDSIDDRPNGDITDGRGSASLKRTTEQWLAKAAADYRLAERAAAPPDPLWDGVCYHAQQCVEKCVKALLQEHDIQFPRTHDLVALAGLAGPLLPDLVAIQEDLTWVKQYAVEIRYPGVEAGQAEAERALRIATEVRDRVRGALELGREDLERGQEEAP